MASVSQCTPVLIDDLETDRWGLFVDDHPEATIFHDRRWLQAIANTFGYEPYHHLIYGPDGDRPVAALPAFAIRRGLGKTLVNPFCEYGLPLIAESVDDASVLECLTELGGRFDALFLKDTQWSSVHGYNQAGYGAVQTGITRRLSLDDSFDDIWSSRFDRKVRSRVRVAEERGFDVAIGTIEQFYRQYVSTMARLGSPPFPLAFFRELRRQFGDVVRPLVVTLDGTQVASMFTLSWGDELILWGHASKQEYWDAHPNELLYTRAIERACNDDLQVVDFGRSRRGTGVDEFKKDFGGEEYWLTTFVSPPHRSGHASLGSYEQFAPVTKRLSPLITHPRIGPELKRYIHE